MNKEFQSPFKTLLKSNFAHNCYMFLLFSLCPLLLYQPAFQNDTYWLINTGKYIVHNGFPYTEPFTIHQGLDFIVQQWLSTILFHESYQMGGVAGVHILIIGICAVTLFLIYRLALALAGGNILIASYVTVFLGVCLCSSRCRDPRYFHCCCLSRRYLFLNGMFVTRSDSWR